MIPPIDARGLLPPGIHKADFDDLILRFGTTPLRRRMISDLRRWAALELPAEVVDSLLIAGSFVSEKSSPEDIDVSIVFDGTSEAGQALERKINTMAARLWRDHRIDMFANAALLFQFVGDKASRLHGRPTGLRGMVSLVEFFRDTPRTRDLELGAWGGGCT